MFTLFPEPPIKKQISLYVSWKAIRHPTTAESHRRMLTEFSRYRRLKCATDIDKEAIQDFIQSRNGEFYRGLAEKSLRGFFMYWCKMGVLTKDFDSVVKEDIVSDMASKLHPLLHVDNARRVQALQREGLSLRQIKLKMETEDGKTYQLKSIHRWSKYDVSLSPSGA
jgi:hypothetical protein